MKRHFTEYLDVYIWIWTNAKVLRDPHRQFSDVVSEFRGYPKDILIRKIKYRWLLANYWAIEVYPHNHSSESEILPAAMALLNSVGELCKFFFIVEGKPYPYTEKLPKFVESTALGKEFSPLMRDITELVVGTGRGSGTDVWQRLDEAVRMLCYSDESEECRRLETACAEAMLKAGVDDTWVAADYNNIDQLLSGKLGPVP